MQDTTTWYKRMATQLGRLLTASLGLLLIIVSLGYAEDKTTEEKMGIGQIGDDISSNISKVHNYHAAKYYSEYVMAFDSLSEKDQALVADTLYANYVNKDNPIESLAPELQELVKNLRVPLVMKNAIEDEFTKNGADPEWDIDAFNEVLLEIRELGYSGLETFNDLLTFSNIANEIYIVVEGQHLDAVLKQKKLESQQLDAEEQRVYAVLKQKKLELQQLDAEEQRVYAVLKQKKLELQQLDAEGQQLDAEGQQLDAEGQQLDAEGQQLDAEGQQLSRVSESAGEALAAAREAANAAGLVNPAD